MSDAGGCASELAQRLGPRIGEETTMKKTNVDVSLSYEESAMLCVLVRDQLYKNDEFSKINEAGRAMQQWVGALWTKLKTANDKSRRER